MYVDHVMQADTGVDLDFLLPVVDEMPAPA
jgi:hypothetical protein